MKDQEDDHPSPIAPDSFAPGDRDPRSPIKQLLDLFRLEEESTAGGNNALLNSGSAAAAASDDKPAPGAQPVVPETDGHAGGADVHLSAPALPFLNWHLTAASFPDEYQVPLRVPMLDAVATTVPEAPATPAEEPSFQDRLLNPIHDAISKVKHDFAAQKLVDERVAKIKQARALMPVIPQGKAAGTLRASGNYNTVIRGQIVTSSGWMFQEPDNSDYGKWFAHQMRVRYDLAVRKYNEQKKAHPEKAKNVAWGQVGNAAAAIAVSRQEAAPSGICTYDGRVLSWGIGLAAPGLLQKVMYQIVTDPKPSGFKVRKAFYLCGFKYDAEVRPAGSGGRDHYHGIYQIVDLTTSQAGIVFGDNFHHDTVQGKHKKGGFQGNGFLALKALTAQLELIYMLIQVARDPETRGVVFRHNYNYVTGAMNVSGFGKIESEALYVFIAQVQHNWDISRHDPVKYAISTMDDAEKGLAMPSAEADKAIAKGIVRLIMRVLQEQPFLNGVRYLRSGKYPKGMSKDTKLRYFPAATEFVLPRLIENYWQPLQTGGNTQDKSKVEVPGFLVPTGSSAAGNYIWDEGG